MRRLLEDLARRSKELKVASAAVGILLSTERSAGSSGTGYGPWRI